ARAGVGTVSAPPATNQMSRACGFAGRVHFGENPPLRREDQARRPDSKPDPLAGALRQRQACRLPCSTNIRVHIMLTWRSRQALKAWGCMLAAMLILASNPGRAADSPIRTVDVTYDGETYVLNAVMFAPVAQSVAWDVLTDFDHMAQWVPNVSESKVVKREDNSVTIEQHGVAKYGAVSFPYVTERKIELKPPGTIVSSQIK